MLDNSMDDFIISSDDFSSSDSDDESEVQTYKLEQTTHGSRVLKNPTSIPFKELHGNERIPYNIDGSCAFRMTGSSRSDLMPRTRDGRPWLTKDSGTKWKNYTSVRYKECAGSLKCINVDCNQQMEAEKVSGEKDGFDKQTGACHKCGIKGVLGPCEDVRKYVATKVDRGRITIDVFHVGLHTCSAKPVVERQSKAVAKSLATDPKIKPSGIQSNAIMTMLRERKSWDDIRTNAQKFRCKKSISNEKIKQLKAMRPAGTSFNAVKKLKEFTDTEDEFLVATVDENLQVVFKTSKLQMKLAMEMSTPGRLLAKELCCFDGKKKRTKNFTTLTASVYHALLKKQVPLAIMECVREDNVNVEVFWREFNKIYKEANEQDTRFNPREGWITDMAEANHTGLIKIYGEDVMALIKGCEFHFMKRVNERTKGFAENGEEFKALAQTMMESCTIPSYLAAYKALCTFLESNSQSKMKEDWLDWWHERRHFIFRAFTRRNLPRMNQAEVVHAGMVNRDEVGVDLVTSTELDVKESIFLAADMEHLALGGGGSGRGPILAKLLERREEQEIDTARQIGQDLLQHGLDDSVEEQEQERAAATVEHEKRKTTSATAKMFEKRKADLNNVSWKIKSVSKDNDQKRSYTIQVSKRSNVTTRICNIPSCDCSDFRKYGDKVCCRHIMFMAMIALQGGPALEEELRTIHINDETVAKLFQTNIPDRFLSKRTSGPPSTSSPASGSMKQVLQQDPRYWQEQVWLLHKKEKRSAHCASRICKKKIEIDTECFRVEGALIVASGDVHPGRFYFCADNLRCCNGSSVPGYSNVMQPVSFADEATKQRMSMLGVPV